MNQISNVLLFEGLRQAEKRTPTLLPLTVESLVETLPFPVLLLTNHLVTPQSSASSSYAASPSGVSIKSDDEMHESDSDSRFRSTPTSETPYRRYTLYYANKAVKDLNPSFSTDSTSNQQTSNSKEDSGWFSSNSTSDLPSLFRTQVSNPSSLLEIQEWLADDARFIATMDTSFQQKTTITASISFEVDVDENTHVTYWQLSVHPFEDRFVCIFQPQSPSANTSINNTSTPAKTNIKPIQKSKHNPLKIKKKGTVANLANAPLSNSGSGIFVSQSPTNIIHFKKKRKGESVVTEHETKSISKVSFSSIVEKIPQKVWVTNSEGAVEYFNKFWEEYTGITLDVLLGWGWGLVLHPDDSARCMEVWSRSYITGAPYDIEYRFKDAHGNYRWHLGRANPLRDENQNIIKWVGTSTDIHEQKMAEEERRVALLALQESESRFRKLYDSGIIGILFLSLNGPITDANDMFLEIIGYTREDLRNGLSWKNLTPPSYEELDLNAQKQLAVGGSCKPYEKSYIRKDGTLVPILIGAALLDGSTEDCIVFVLDITATKKAEESALQAAKAKAFFIANISHEIRTPLNGVCGMTELLFDTDLTDQQREYLVTIKKSSEVLLMLINNILDFSKMEVGKMTLEISQFEIQTVVEDIVDLLGEAANAKGIDFFYVVRANAAAYSSVAGDHGRLRQILINLVNNAIKFTDKGEVKIEVSLSELHKEEKEVTLLFKISDTGVGIGPEQKPKLFQPFTQLDNSSTRLHPGTGLGLTICRQLVELFKGTIGVDSEYGKGSTFWFTVRLKVATELLDNPHSTNFPFMANVRVLIVVANATMRDVLQEYFDSWSINCSVVANNTQALKLLRNAINEGKPFSAAFVCVANIYQLARVIETANGELAQLKLICIGSNSVHVRSKSIAGYLSKPIRQSRVFDTLMRVLSISPAEEINGGSNIYKRQMSIPMVSPLSSQQTANTILIVEDNAVNQKVAIKQLERLGINSVVTAGNGLEALKLLEQSSFGYALVFMDCQMPVMDGLTATKEIRRIEEENNLARIPIVAMTANAMNDAIGQCMSAGMDDYISKPVKIDSMRAVLSKWLPTCSAERIMRRGSHGSSGSDSIDSAESSVSSRLYEEDHNSKSEQ